MSWEQQKILLLAIVGMMIAVLSFAIGVAFGVSSDFEMFQSTLIPLLSMLGTWVAGIATVGAVIAALWLAEIEKRSDSENIKVWSGFVIIPGEPGELFCIKITSDGKRPTNLTSISIFSKSTNPALVIIGFHSLGSTLPASLGYGVAATFIMRTDFADAIAKYIAVNCSGSAKNLKLAISSTIKNYQFDLDNDLKKLLEENAKKFST